MNHTQFKGGCCCSTPVWPIADSSISENGLTITEKATSVFQALSSNFYKPGTAIFYNGTIRPMAGGDANISESAIAFDSETIIKVGSLEDCREAAPGAQEIDLKGRTLLPGLVEPHVHVLNTAIFSTWVDVSPFNGQYLQEEYTLQTVYDKMKDALNDSRNIQAGWLLCFGVDPSMFRGIPPEEWQDPTATDLDENVSSDIPIFMMNSSGHLAYANTLGLKESGSDNTNGILLERDLVPVIAYVITKVVSDNPTEFITNLVTNMFDMMITASSRGTTLLWDALLGISKKKGELDLLSKVANSGYCPVRYGGALSMTEDTSLEGWEKEGVHPETYTGERFRVPTCKIVSDGSNQGLTGYQYDVYANPNEYINVGDHEKGIWNLEGVNLPEMMKDIDSAGWAFMIHANGDRAIADVLDGYKAVADQNNCVSERRNRIEHCSLLRPETLPQMAEYHVSPSYLIGHVGYWGYTFQNKVFTPEKAASLDQTRGALNHNLRFSLHSDHFVSPLGPLRMAEQAITRQMEADPERNVLNPDECVTMAEALRAITYDGAWQCHMDDVCGELVAGKRPDFVILGTDPMKMESAVGLRDVEVYETWLNGVRVYKNGQTNVIWNAIKGIIRIVFTPISLITYPFQKLLGLKR